jgi:signal transduction histidine kinase
MSPVVGLRGRSRWFGLPRVDIVVAGLLLTITTLDMALRSLQAGQHRNDVLGYLLVIGMAAPYAIHRRAPLTAATVVLSLLLVYSLVPYNAYPGLNALVLLFGIASHSQRRRSLIALAATFTALTLAVAVQPDGIVDRSTWLTTELATAAAWLAGDNVRQRRTRIAAQREREASLMRERGEQAKHAVNEERLRIAREMHDVVAHSMSVIVVQSAVATHTINSQPQEAAQALAAIETTSREALVEMRRLVGVLREENTPAAQLMPAPGLADVPQLVAQVEAAGVHASLRVEGEVFPLPAGVDLSAYRIVQEALTNVIKHGGATARVTLRHAPTHISVEVTDPGVDGSQQPAWGGLAPTTGHGLIGMRERVAVFGGELAAGPRPGGGFKVVARLPIAATGS